MKTKKLSKKLTLNKTTISYLEQPQMDGMKGGFSARNCEPQPTGIPQFPTECDCPLTMTLCGVLQCP